MQTQAYRGYLMTVGIDGLVRVTKDGFLICTAATVGGAKTAIDGLLN